MSDLSIVLFGLPAAGKSSLLGALAQAAQSQEHLLNGRLRDVSHGLDELRQRVYDETPRRTAEEVVPYPVDYEPFAEGKGAAARHVGAVVLDCDGRVANDLLVRRQELPEDSPEGTLAREVVDADTLVLAIDASAPPAQVESDFAEFDRFLRQLELSRGRRAEVGGLPVFLVLTKCDLLARPDDGPADWMERVEQHKRDLGARFRSFLERRQQEAGPLPFGKLDLHLWATAVKRPALAGAPARAREPYGVAELFRQCLAEAETFRSRRRQAGRRLLWTVGAAGGVVALMAGMMLYFVVPALDAQAAELRDRAEMLRLGDLPSAAERLRPSVREELRPRARQFQAVHDDPRFDALPAAQRQFVNDRLGELTAYLRYHDRLEQSPRPQDVDNEEALQKIQDALREQLALPEPEWQDTEAGRLYAARRKDAEALARAVRGVRNRYLDGATKADALATFQGQSAAGVDWDGWARAAEKLLASQDRPPAADAERVPGAETPLTYGATVLRFREVNDARADWKKYRLRLQHLLDLTAALGLAPAAEGRPPLLVIPRPFTLAQARERSKALAKAYPDHAKEFVPDAVPDRIRPQVARAARTSYEHLLAPAHAAVLGRLRRDDGKAEDSPAGWKTVRDWLRDPRELDGWRALANVLRRLDRPEAADPVTELAELLEKDSFPLEIQRLTLEVPEGLGVKPTADGRLSVYHRDRVALTFEPSGEGERDAPRRVWVYSYRPADGARLTYRPGDSLWATLPLRDERMFTWSGSRSLTYQFERLTKPPRLHRASEAVSPGDELAENVRLILRPPDGVPPLPDLLPVVSLKGKE